LIPLIRFKRVLALQVRRVVDVDGVRTIYGFEGDLRRLKLRKEFDDLGDLFLALLGQVIVNIGLHIILVRVA
jgi:hypothetical protein